MKFRLSILLLFLTINGCQVGPRIEEFEQSRRPEGVTTTIKLHHGFAEGGELRGELLEVREHGLLLNARTIQEGGVVERRVVFVAYTAMIDLELDELGLRMLSEGDTKTRRVRHQEKLRLLSRFPQGLSTPLLGQLLAAEGQNSLYVIGSE
jgi:hypothetical protein